MTPWSFVLSHDDEVIVFYEQPILFYFHKIDILIN